MYFFVPCLLRDSENEEFVNLDLDAPEERCVTSDDPNNSCEGD